jgi:uncharacterized protein YfaS (alpha-2-macroglobulin family)
MSYLRLLLAFISLVKFSHAADFIFPTYLENDAQHYTQEIKGQYGVANDQELESLQKSLDNLVKEKKWATALTKAEEMLASAQNKADVLINIAIFCHTARQYVKHKTYEYRRLQLTATYYAFISATTDLQKAKALILYALIDNTEYADQNILNSVNNLCNFTEIKKSDDRFNDLLKFEFIKYSLEESADSSTLHIKFSHQLDCKNPENYIEISPKADGYISCSLNEITVSGLEPGKEYTVKIRSGLKSIYDEKIEDSKEINFFVKDLTPRISFSSKAYVYPKQEKIHIPIRVSNIDDAKVNLYHVPDRQVIEKKGEILSEYFNESNLEKVFTTTLHFDGNKTPNKTIVKNLDINQATSDIKPGLYVLSAKQKGSFSTHGYDSEKATQWFTVTDIGLATYASDKSFIVQARSFATAKPIKGLELELIAKNNEVLATAKTDSDGFAEFPKELMLGKAGKRPSCVFANDTKLGFSFLLLNKPAFDFSDRGVKGRAIVDDYDAMVFTERGIYRPEEPVNIGIVLKDAQGQTVAPTPLTIIYKSPKGIEIKRETLKGNELGIYSTNFILPNDSAIGMWSAEVYVDSTQKSVGHATFRVDDFSPNKMDLSLKAEKKSAKLGEVVEATLTAHYLYGAAVDNRKTVLEGKINPDFTPFEKWQEFCFGDESAKFTSAILGTVAADITQGKANYKIMIPQNISSSLPLKVEINIRLVDTPASQSAATNLLLLTKPYVIGVKEIESSSSDNIELEIIAVDSEGNLVTSEELQYNFYKSNAIYQWFKEYNAWNYQRIYQDTLLDKGKIRTKSETPTAVKIKAEKGETYVFEIKNKEEVVAKYRIGKHYFSKADRPDTVVITPESKAVKSGDHAVLRIKAPFAGEATIIAGLNSVILKDTAHLDEGINIVKIPTDESWGSGAYVMISLVRPLDKKTRGIKSKRAVGVQWIKIDSEQNKLNINFELPKTIKPKSQLTIPIELEGIKDTAAKVMLAVVDEGVLGLTSFKTPNPLEFFFGQRQLGIEMRDIYGYIIDPIEADVLNMRSGGDALMLRRGAFVPKMHEKVLSFFDGNVHINNHGKAEIAVDIPAFFGKVKVYALAFAKDKMGMQENIVIVKDNLIVDLNSPTFLTMGDKTQINARFENTTDKPCEAVININTEKALKTNARKIELNLKPKEQQVITIDIEANQLGEGSIRIVADGKGIAYDNTFTIDVRSPLQPGIVSQTFKVEAKETKTISSTELLKDMLATNTMATIYITNQGPWNTGKIMQWLMQYPFGCTQQTISKGFAALYAMQQYKEDQKNSKYNEYKNTCYSVIEILNERQLPSGGWGMWGNDGIDYNITAFAVEFLLYAKSKNLNVAKHILEKAITAIHREANNFNRYIKNNQKTAAWLIKICGQTKEFDTSTVRYCFDNFFDKCDSAVAKALFVSTVAQIQDLARLTQGIKELKNAIAKGISVEDSVDIAAHLAPYTEIDSIKTIVDSVAAALTNPPQESIERVNTQTLAMVLKAQFENLTDNSKNKTLKATINNHEINKQNSYFYTLDSVKDTKISNEGDEAIWVFTNTYGTPKQEPTKTQESGVQVAKNLFDISGKAIEQEHIKIGDKVVVVLEITIDKDKAKNTGYWLISDWLPSGLSHTNVFSKYEWLQDLTTLSLEQKRHDRYVASFKTKPHQNTITIAYETIATCIGEFVQPGLYIENMLTPEIFASYEPTKMIVEKTS